MQKRKMAFLAALFTIILIGLCSSFIAAKRKENKIAVSTCMSMDWDSDDSLYLEKVAEYHGGNLYDRVYTIRVTLNLVWRDKRPIRDVVLEELYEHDGINEYEFESIIPSDLSIEALRKIMYEKFDNSDGSTTYIEFYEDSLHNYIK